MATAGPGPSFRPFRAWRYAPGIDLDPVIAPPYDVLGAADVALLRSRSPHNVVHVDVPAGDTPERYAAAARLLRAWQAQGVLVRDSRPSLTIYRMAFRDGAGRDRVLSGVLGGLEVADEGAGRVLPHERTTPKASSDRLELTRATATNLSPVWGLGLGSGLTEALALPGEPVGRLVVAGVEHVVERVDDPGRIAEIADRVGADDVLIADGHHRYAVARAHRDEVRERTGRRDTPAEHTLAFVGELAPEQLAIEPIHRLVTGIPGQALVAALERDFAVVPGAGPLGSELVAAMVDLGRLVLLLPDGSASWLAPRAGAFDRVRTLDGAWLEHALAGSGAGLDYQHGVAEAAAAVAAGRAQAAILIRPTSLTEIERTAREGLLMPPKSTFFTPKLRTGLVLRALDSV